MQEYVGHPARAGVAAARVPPDLPALKDGAGDPPRPPVGVVVPVVELSDPCLSADYVLPDEARDANPVVAAIVDGYAQRILVGDCCQAFYGWRGGVD